MCWAIKLILHPVILSNPEGPVLYAQPTAITKGRHKTDSTKKDKSQWQGIQIAHATMKNSSESGPDRGLGCVSLEEGGPHAPGGRGRGCIRG